MFEDAAKIKTIPSMIPINDYIKSPILNYYIMCVCYCVMTVTVVIYRVAVPSSLHRPFSQPLPPPPCV